jgi:hypothetical protein
MLKPNPKLGGSRSFRLRKAYVAASLPAFVTHHQGATKRSDCCLVVVLDLLG